VGDLHQDSGAVASVYLAATCAAVFKIQQHFERFWDYCIRLSPFRVDNKADSAGVMFECRIIQTLFGWSASVCHLFSPFSCGCIFCKFPTAFDDAGLAGPKYRAESPPSSLPASALWVPLQSGMTFELP